MSSEHASFLYTPLQLGQIRLLHPVVGLSSGELRWVLKVVQFQDSLGQGVGLEYDALSYTWGDSTKAPEFPVICNDRKLNVHYNLSIALPFLARRKSHVPIWMDAICINQADKLEKMNQIGMMVKIYQRASQVWVWLGPGNEKSGVVISKLPQLVNEIETNETKKLEMFTTNPKIMPWLDSNEEWSTLSDLADNGWYGRLWVVQEAAFARRLRVLMGKHEIEWDILHRVIAGSSHWHIAATDGSQPNTKNKGARNIFEIREITQKALKAGRGLNAREAAKIVMSTMRSLCREPEDRVFALLGFIQIEVPHNTPLVDMYVRLARSILLKVGLESAHWWAFLQSASSSNKHKGLPSWCPDFHDVVGRGHSVGLVRNYGASVRRNKVERHVDLQSKELAVRGQIFDTVDTTFDVYREHKGAVYQRVDALHSWEETLEAAIRSKMLFPRSSHSEKEVDATAISDIYWATLNSHFSGNKRPLPLPYKSLEDFRNGKSKTLQRLQTLELLEESAFAQQQSHMSVPEIVQHVIGITPINSTMDGQRLFTTTHGRLGRGPSIMESGDRICIFSYARTAHILRRDSEEDQSTYRLIGEAYIHGMMNGEIEKLEIEEEDVILM